MNCEFLRSENNCYFISNRNYLCEDEILLKENGMNVLAVKFLNKLKDYFFNIETVNWQSIVYDVEQDITSTVSIQDNDCHSLS